MLYQEENPGIEFEYSLKKDTVKQTPSGSGGGYSWTQSSWGECNAPCGGGTRAREVFCSQVDILNSQTEAGIAVIRAEAERARRELIRAREHERARHVGRWTGEVMSIMLGSAL